MGWCRFYSCYWFSVFFQVGSVFENIAISIPIVQIPHCFEYLVQQIGRNTEHVFNKILIIINV